MIIKDYLKAGYPLIWLQSHEPDRVTGEITSYYTKNPASNGDDPVFYEVWKWDIVSGWVDQKCKNNRTQAGDPISALKTILEMPSPGIFILEGFHKFLDNPVTIQMIKNIRDIVKVSAQPIVFISPEVNLPVELQKDILLADYSLPTVEDLKYLLSQVLAVFSFDPIEELNQIIAEAALGLSLFEAENVFTLSIVKNKLQFNKDCLKTILEEKQQIIKKSGFLEYEHSQTNLGDVGGLDNLKSWLNIREKALTHKAKEYGLPAPKGILLVGVPGTGKSLVAKSIAKSWNLPLIKFDIGRIFGSLVGQSESNVRAAIKTIEAMDRCVVWIDEIEKAMAGSGSSGQTDSGVTARVMGNILTWMQEKTGNSFIVATANQVQNLPPEMLRKGRWDEIFSVDLPSAKERAEILNIHLAKRNKNTSPSFITTTVIQKTNNFTGAELEQVIIDAMYLAFNEGRELKESDLIRAINETTPIAVTMKEQISSLRTWAKHRTRPAAKTDTQDQARLY